MTPEKFYGKEIQMQRYRWATPIGLALNLFTSIGGMSGVGYFANRYIDEQDKKSQILFEELKETKAKEDGDVLLLTEHVYACCGQKANIN